MQDSGPNSVSDILTHLPLVPHNNNVSVIQVSIGSDNGLSPIRCQAII